jgi:hypothetical protein
MSEAEGRPEVTSALQNDAFDPPQTLPVPFIPRCPVAVC